MVIKAVDHFEPDAKFVNVLAQLAQHGCRSKCIEWLIFLLYKPKVSNIELSASELSVNRGKEFYRNAMFFPHPK